jgi:hypothetical protein
VIVSKLNPWAKSSSKTEKLKKKEVMSAEFNLAPKELMLLHLSRMRVAHAVCIALSVFRVHLLISRSFSPASHI